MSNRFYHLTKWNDVGGMVGRTFCMPVPVSNYWNAQFGPIPEAYDCSWARTIVQKSSIRDAQQDLLIELLVRGKRAMDLAKDYLFEEVRAIEFLNAPSRMRCLLAFDQDVEPTAMANLLGWNLETMGLVEIQPLPTAKVLRVRIADLNCSSDSRSEMVRHARRYWSGSDASDESCEILLEGCFTVTQALKETPSSVARTGG